MTRHAGAALVLAATVAIVAACGAVAYWRGSGHGSLPTTLASPDQLTLSAGVAQAQLVPGHHASVVATATNPNAYFVHIASLELNTSAGTGGFEVDAGHSGCDLASLGLAPDDNGGAGWSVPPKVAATSGSLAIVLHGALSMGPGAASACQGAAFTVHLAAGS